MDSGTSFSMVEPGGPTICSGSKPFLARQIATLSRLMKKSLRARNPTIAISRKASTSSPVRTMRIAPALRQVLSVHASLEGLTRNS